MAVRKKKQPLKPRVEDSRQQRFTVAYNCPSVLSLAGVLKRFSEEILAFVNTALSGPGNTVLTVIKITPYECEDNEALEVIVRFTRDMTDQEILDRNIKEEINKKKKRETLDAMINEFGSLEKLIQYTNG